MKMFRLLLATVFILIGINSFSQEMTEKEKKALKKEMMKLAKETDGELLAEMFERYPKLLKKEEELESANKEIVKLKKQIESYNHQHEASKVGLENKANGERFLKELETKKGIIKTSSGLMYEIINKGEGDSPQATNTVKVHYEGTFIDGKVFDSSIQRGEPIEFGLNRVIKGWTEGLQLMNRGAKYRFYIPYNLAYGERGRSSIPAYSTLVFDVDLIDFK